VPTPSVKLLPCISRGDRVRTFTTPLIAFAPQIAEAGPRMTSICFISLKLIGRKSQATKPKKSW
jgi:hypothetical protein